MTDALEQPGLGTRLGATLHRAGAVLGKAGFVLFMLAALVAALVAASLIGLMVAIAALFLSIAYGVGRSRRTARAQAQDDTLEARQTADGWVIEPQGFTRG
jgi:hypothetical protein